MKKLLITVIAAAAVLSLSVTAFAAKNIKFLSGVGASQNQPPVKQVSLENKKTTRSGCSFMDENGAFIDRDEYLKDLEEQLEEGQITEEEKEDLTQLYDRMKEYCTQSGAAGSSGGAQPGSGGPRGCH
jgi:hypothetical protein